MQFHPVVGSLPIHEHSVILDAFMPVFLEQREQYMGLFPELHVDFKVFFDGSRSLVEKYLDFFHTVILSKLTAGGDFVIDNGGIFSDEIEAIAGIVDLSEVEKEKLERIIILTVGYSTELLEGSEYFESYYIHAIVNYVKNAAVGIDDIARIVRGVILYDSVEGPEEIRPSSDKDYYMRMLVSAVIKELERDRNFPEEKRRALLSAGVSAISEGEKSRSECQQDANLSLLLRHFGKLGANVSDELKGEPAQLPVDKIMSLVDSILAHEKHDELNPGQFDSPTLACINFKRALGDDPVKINAQFIKLLIDFRLSLAYGAFALDAYRESVDELMKLLPKIISSACSDNILSVSERHDVICSLLKNKSPFAESGRYADLLDIVSQGVSISHETLFDALDNSCVVRFLTKKIGGECHSSPLKYDQSMATFNKSKHLCSSLLVKQGVRASECQEYISATKFLNALIQRQFYQFFLYPALSKNGELKYDDFASVFTAGLENGVLGRNELCLLPPASVRQLYEAGGEKMAEIISARPRLNEVMVNLLLMDKIEQLDDGKSPSLLRKSSRAI